MRLVRRAQPHYACDDGDRFEGISFLAIIMMSLNVSVVADMIVILIPSNVFEIGLVTHR